MKSLIIAAIVTAVTVWALSRAVDSLTEQQSNQIAHVQGKIERAGR
jgi:hypothetical protein